MNSVTFKKSRLPEDTVYLDTLTDPLEYGFVADDEISFTFYFGSEGKVVYLCDAAAPDEPVVAEYGGSYVLYFKKKESR